MKTAKARKHQSIAAMIVCMIILTGISSCEKYNIKNNYTGIYDFTVISHDGTLMGDTTYYNDDTLVSEGSIGLYDDNVLTILINKETYTAVVDKDGQLTAYKAESSDPHEKIEMNGTIAKKGDVSINYYESYAFLSNSSSKQRIITGTRH